MAYWLIQATAPFIRERASSHPIRRLCRIMNVHPSGYYAWQHQPLSAQALKEQRLLDQIKQCWLESGGVYGYPIIWDDLREMGETCGKYQVARLIRHEGLRSQTGYRRRPGHYGGRPTVVASNHLERQFGVNEPKV